MSSGAIYHASLKRISRKEGRSAVHAAAYRAGEDLTDERTGTKAEYAHRQEHGAIGQTMLVMPNGSTADRGEFWNSVEAHHKRGDANLAWEIELALPTALSDEQNAALIRAYAAELAKRYGVAVDACIHTSKDNRTTGDWNDMGGIFEPPESKPDNPHAHIMLSACTVGMDNVLGKKCNELDPIHCARAKIDNAADRERPKWAELVNQALAAAGHDVRVDHRTNEARGLELDAMRHEGKSINAWAEIVTHNELVRSDAAEIAKLDAEYALETTKLQAMMREIERINEKRKPFTPRDLSEAQQLERRVDGIVAERVKNHTEDMKRLDVVKQRLEELHPIYTSEPQFFEYKKRKKKAEIAVEYRTLYAEYKPLNSASKIGCAREQVIADLVKEFPDYAPAMQAAQGIIQKDVAVKAAESSAKAAADDRARQAEIVKEQRIGVQKLNELRTAKNLSGLDRAFQIFETFNAQNASDAGLFDWSAREFFELKKSFDQTKRTFLHDFGSEHGFFQRTAHHFKYHAADFRQIMRDVEKYDVQLLKSRISGDLSDMELRQHQSNENTLKTQNTRKNDNGYGPSM